MATTFTSGYLKSYTNDTWTELIAAPAGKTLVLKHYMFMNTGGSETDVSMRIVDSVPTELAVVVSDYLLTTDKPLNCTEAFIVLTDEQAIQVKADAAGVHFSIWGGYD